MRISGGFIDRRHLNIRRTRATAKFKTEMPAHSRMPGPRPACLVLLLLSAQAWGLAPRSTGRLNIRNPNLAAYTVPYTRTEHQSPYLPIVLWHGERPPPIASHACSAVEVSHHKVYSVFQSNMENLKNDCFSLGMGDTCCQPHSIGAIKSYIQDVLPGVFVHSIATGATLGGDLWSGYFGSVNAQVEAVCDQLRKIPQLQSDGFVGIGFSQGGQFLRAVMQRCQHVGPKMHTLVTMGAQHQGIMDIPGCWQPSFNETPSQACRIMQKVLEWGAYSPLIRSLSVQAQYFKDFEVLETYQRRSMFLADINAEALPSRPSVYDQYKKNLVSLSKLVLFQFDDDVTVVPKESAHFGFYDGIRSMPLNESELWREDRLGLRELSDRGGLVFEHVPGEHMSFSLDWFGKHVLWPYLAVELSSLNEVESLKDGK